jgi:hypothetical protein
MKLAQQTLSADLELVDGPADDGQLVTITETGDTGPNGHPMVRVKGTLSALTAWLRTAYGMMDEDILATLPDFQIVLPLKLDGPESKG